MLSHSSLSTHTWNICIWATVQCPLSGTLFSCKFVLTAYLSVSFIAIYTLLYFSDNLNFMSSRLYYITFFETVVQMTHIIKRDKTTVNIQNILYCSVIFHGWRWARTLAAVRRSLFAVGWQSLRCVTSGCLLLPFSRQNRSVGMYCSPVAPHTRTFLVHTTWKTVT
jgi:hypothetical protein